MRQIKFISLLSVLYFSINNVSATQLKNSDFTQIFNSYDACFILYDVNENKNVIYYNENNRCNKLIAPDSTFKVPLSIMAFDQKIITESSIFVWDGKDKGMNDWNHNQTPTSWEQYSVVWVSQEITPKIGLPKIKKYLSEFKYGNKDFSGDLGKNNGLTHAWLSSSLKISANNQLEFLKSMQKYTLPVSTDSISYTKQNIYLGKIDNGMKLYGKTGSGYQISTKSDIKKIKLRDGWFIGFVENEKNKYVFVTNLSDKTQTTDMTSMCGPVAKKITIKILNEYFKD